MAEFLKTEAIIYKWIYNYLFKKLLFTMENATAAGSSQSNISRIYIWKDNYYVIPFSHILFVKRHLNNNYYKK